MSVTPSASSALASFAVRHRGLIALTAATLINLPFGTIYAFSVFLKPMEALLGIGRLQMSFVFAMATISFTLGMLLAPWIYHRCKPGFLILLAGTTSCFGLLLAARATSLNELALGYGVLFGLGGGCCYVLVQQALNQSLSKPSGLANGYVVSLYPLGAMLGAPLFGWAISTQGLRFTIASLAAVVALATMLTAFLFWIANLSLHETSPSSKSDEARRWPLFFKLFGVFFLAAASGLTVMSQAAGILQTYGANTVFALGATTIITGAIAAARLGGGFLVDRFAIPRVAFAAHLLALCGALALIALPSPHMALPGLAMIGMGYGLVSGLTAGAIARYWHKNIFGKVAGQIYIAWCIAAISLPLLAGWLYDQTQAYQLAMMVAAGGNLLGALLSLSLPRDVVEDTMQHG